MVILYHGTTETHAKQIIKEGFHPGIRSNWKVKSKPGFVYLSSAYAPFYAMEAKNGNDRKALIKCEVKASDLYPEDDYIMYAMGKPVYSQAELNAVDFEAVKRYAPLSLKYMGNACAKPKDIKILGMMAFSSKNLLMVCDPVISPMNFAIMGEYYKSLTEWIYDGNDPLKFQRDECFPFKGFKKLQETRKVG